MCGRARQATDDSRVKGMRVACRITKAADTHSEYVILIALPWQKWLLECASVLHLYVHCLSCSHGCPQTAHKNVIMRRMLPVDTDFSKTHHNVLNLIFLF